MRINFEIFFEKLFDKSKHAYYTATNQTVEAEITAIMIPQRARVAESRVKHRLSNGPRRVQSNVSFFSQSILQRKANVTCQGYDSIR